MAGLTLSQLRTLVRKLTFEKDGDEGLFEGNLDQFLNIAYQSVFTAIVSENPDYFTKNSADLTFTSAGIAFSAVSVKGAHAIAGVDLKDTSGNYIPVREPGRRIEMGAYEGPGLQATTLEQIAGWFVESETIYLAPTPGVSMTGRVHFVENIADLTLDADVPFGGMLAGYHDVIALECALAMLDKDSAVGVLERTHGRRWNLLMKHVRRTQVAKPRRQHRTDTEE